VSAFNTRMHRSPPVSSQPRSSTTRAIVTPSAARSGAGVRTSSESHRRSRRDNPRTEAKPPRSSEAIAQQS
jgi:hypothetical protein